MTKLPISLVRVHTKVRDPKSKEYIQAVQEFAEKMGGVEQLQVVLRMLEKSKEPELFDNVWGRKITIRRQDEEDPHLSM
jgi:hypothetical protein